MSDPLDELTTEFIEDWFYCIEHAAVEPRDGCKITERLGPYPTKEAAANALEQVEERNDDWDEDPAWNDDIDDNPGNDTNAGD